MDERSAAAQAAGVCHTFEECEGLYAGIDPLKKQKAIDFLRSKLPLDQADKFRKLILLYGKHDWLWHIYDDEIAKLTEEERRYSVIFYNPHHGWGMAIRNLLRKHGFGEESLKVHNLDDIYIQLLEDALKEKEK